MNRFINNGLCLEFELIGSGVPFVFLHGMGGSTEQISSTYEPIEGVQLINLNQQGHGNSHVNWDTYDFDTLADDLVALLDYLDVGKAFIGGISMGAAVALNAGMRYQNRVEKLLLIRNAWTNEPMSNDVQIAYNDLGVTLQEGSLNKFYETKGWKIVSKFSRYTKNSFITPFSDPYCIKYWKKYMILPSKTPISSLDELKNLTIPVTILANRNDFCHPFEYGELLRNHIDGAELVEIVDKDKDKAGHNATINKAIKKMIIS